MKVSVRMRASTERTKGKKNKRKSETKLHCYKGLRKSKVKRFQGGTAFCDSSSVRFSAFGRAGRVFLCDPRAKEEVVARLRCIDRAELANGLEARVHYTLKLKRKGNAAKSDPHNNEFKLFGINAEYLRKHVYFAPLTQNFRRGHFDRKSIHAAFDIYQFFGCLLCGLAHLVSCWVGSACIPIRFNQAWVCWQSEGSVASWTHRRLRAIDRLPKPRAIRKTRPE